MSDNVYRADDSEPAPAQGPHPFKARANSTLELVVANCNLQLGSGVNYVNRLGKHLRRRDVEADSKNGKAQEFYRQPFWFVYEPGETIVVYVEAEMHRAYNDSGNLMIRFDATEPKASLRELLINWYAARAAGISLVTFGGSRGFTIKSGRGRFG